MNRESNRSTEISPTAATLQVTAAPSSGRSQRLAELLLGSGTPVSDETRRLLRRQLLKVASIVTVTFAVYSVLSRLDPVYRMWTRVYTAFDYVVDYSIFGLCVGWCLVLWRRPDLSLPKLRILEFLVFGSVAVVSIHGQLAWYQDRWIVDKATAEFLDEINLVATESASLTWSLLIIVYGTFIPNTPRRCAVVAGVLAVIPVLTTLGLWSIDDPNSPRLFLFSALEAAIVMAISWSIAYLGSRKMELLREEARAARQVGPYRLRECLGRGGMGEVYRAQHHLLKRPCVVKLIRAEQAGDAVALERFEREVQATANLTHWNTVAIFDFGKTEDGTFYYAMEYLPGLDLDDVVERGGPIPPARAVHFLRQVCDSLSEAHSIGLIHRDVKPGNIVACERGGIYDVVKLLDFGLVRDAGLDSSSGSGDRKLTREGFVAGSPIYMSPEQASAAELDGRSDIYSVGATAYFLLTGRPPFVKPTNMKVLVAHIHEIPEPPSVHVPCLPGDLESIILRCLAKEPADRYASAGELQAALAGCNCASAWSQADSKRWWTEHAPAVGRRPEDACLETGTHE